MASARYYLGESYLKLGDTDITDETLIAVNTDGTFLYTGKVPFNEATGAAGGSSASSSSYRSVA